MWETRARSLSQQRRCQKEIEWPLSERGAAGGLSFEALYYFASFLLVLFSSVCFADSFCGSNLSQTARSVCDGVGNPIGLEFVAPNVTEFAVIPSYYYRMTSKVAGSSTCTRKNAIDEKDVLRASIRHSFITSFDE
ncbi:hypothetical protein CEXT_68971 [Caerostris extrusa]|uniref:Uncharacterized protein n=1 Tax=Caerostris extrusa TaxID=172846 RepID=A0AAV4TCV0_CAEEX|nr:hypothetical protein CEXT_68971 [Caerostris extrusa]